MACLTDLATCGEGDQHEQDDVHTPLHPPVPRRCCHPHEKVHALHKLRWVAVIVHDPDSGLSIVDFEDNIVCRNLEDGLRKPSQIAKVLGVGGNSV